MTTQEFSIQFVVEQVNQVLTRSYSLVEFDELPPLKHLEILSDIIASLSLPHAVDFSKETQEDGAMKLMDFLVKILNYKIPPLIAHTFPQGFAQGEKSILFPVLHWILSRMPDNHLRVYLARFLTRVEVPDDMKMSDDGLRELYARYEQLRGEFISTHKRVEAVKAANADPSEARRKLASLEAERDRIQTTIATAQKKIATVPRKDALLAACKALRMEQEEAAKLQEKSEEQQQALFTVQRRATEVNHRLRDVRRDVTEGRLDAIMQRVTDEIKAGRIALDQQLPQELNEKRAQCAALQKILTEAVDVAAIEDEGLQLDRELIQLRQKAAERQQPSGDGSNIIMMRQQVQRAVAKKNEVLAELNALQQEGLQLMNELRDKEAQLEQLRSTKVLKGDDFKRYANQVRQKTSAAKTMRQRLNDLRGEFGVLQYTERLLKQKHEALQEEIVALETKYGAKGYFETAKSLSRVSDEKTQVEQIKGRTLEELSVVVQGLVAKIGEKRQKLQPLIIDLKTFRQQAHEIEEDYEEKKAGFEHQQAQMMIDVTKLETEVAALSDEARTTENVFHRINSLMTLVKAQRKRVDDEREFRSGAKELDATAKSYTHLFHASTENLELRSKELQKRRRDIDETHETSLQQVEYFNGLKKLLDCKLACLRKEGASPTGGPVSGAASRSTLDQDIHAMMSAATTRGGVDMLVLGSS